jgi:hypothetical protein
MKISTAVGTLFATLAIATPATAQTESPTWSIAFEVGADMPISGDLHGGGSGSVLGLPTQVTAKSYRDIYGNGFRWSAALGYAFSDTGEVRGQVSWSQLTGERLRVGSVAGLELFGAFDEDRSLGVELGYRRYFTPSTNRVQPFMGLQGGIARVEAIKAEFTVPAAAVTLRDVDMYSTSTVPTFGIGGGIRVNVTDRFSLHGGVDAQWRGGLKEKDGLAGTGLDAINDSSRRWTLPVSFGATVRF